MTKTQRLINRINEVDNFQNVAYLCEDFDTFIDEVAEWGVQSIAKVDFDDPELNPVSYTHLTLPTIYSV